MTAREIDIHTLPSMLTALRQSSFHKLWPERATVGRVEPVEFCIHADQRVDHDPADRSKGMTGGNPA